MTDILVRPLADNRMLRAAGGADLTVSLGQTLKQVFDTPMMTGLVGQSWAQAEAGQGFTEQQMIGLRQSEFERQQEIGSLEAELDWTTDERRDEITLRLGELSKERDVQVQAEMQRSLEEGRLQEPESLTEQYGELGLQFDRPMTEGEAKLLADNKRAELIRQAIISKGPTGVVPGLAKFGAGLAAMAVDPLEVASMFVPVVGVAGRAAAVAKFGKVGGRVLIGATEGFVGSALTEPLYYGLSRQQQLDYTMADALLNVGLGTVFGGGIGAIGGALARADVPTRVDGEPVRVDMPEPVRADIDPITARIEREKADIALRQFTNNQDVDITPISPPISPTRIKGVEVSFDEWIADSKVVDDIGEPLTVFHGTSKSFNRFDPEMRGEVLGDTSGYFFTNERSLAKSYSQLAGGDRVVLEAQLSIKDPLEINVGKEDPSIQWLEGKDEYMRQAEAGGHDGVIVRNDKGDIVPIAFDPDQVRVLNHGVKSAEMKRVEAVRLAENAEQPDDFEAETASKVYDEPISETFIEDDIDVGETVVKQMEEAGDLTPEQKTMIADVKEMEARAKAYAQVSEVAATCMART
jgi:hypothetical protein